jgi:chromate transporter
MAELWKLFWVFFKVGTFAFGGGPSMIPLMEKEVVQSQKWVNLPEFTDLLALGNTLPGPIATKMALAIGYKMAGWMGAAVAFGGLLLPSSVMMMLLILFFFSYKDSPRLQAMLRGVRPAVMALLFVVAYDVGKTSISSVPTILIGISTFFLFMYANLHPAIGLIAAAAIGFIFL